MTFLLSIGVEIRKYIKAKGATSGEAGARAKRHSNTMPESTYIRKGRGPPGPPPRTALVQHLSLKKLNRKVFS
jgi:hypothetical protein